MVDDILKRLDGETENQTLWRIGNEKAIGTLGDITWPEIAEFMNKEFRDSEENYYDSSAYRKRYKNFADAYEQLFCKENFKNEQLVNIEEKTKELFKAKRQFEDQRRECRKLWTEEARFDNLTEKLINSVNRLCEERPLEFNDYVIENENNEAVLVWADWHYGMVTDNIWNQYNTYICRERVTHLVTKTIQYLQRHKIKTLHIMMLGDAAHGGIHTSCRVASEEDADVVYSVAVLQRARIPRFCGDDNILDELVDNANHVNGSIIFCRIIAWSFTVCNYCIRGRGCEFYAERIEQIEQVHLNARTADT